MKYYIEISNKMDQDTRLSRINVNGRVSERR